MNTTMLRGAVSALVCIAPLASQAQNAINVRGNLRTHLENRQSASQGPLADANALQSGIVPFTSESSTAEAELRANGQHWSFAGTADSSRGTGLVNEAAFHIDAGGWQLTAGKKLLGWDVGYAFRPNDVVQQEVRRTLVSTLPEGRPLVMADYVGGDSAWTLVAVNPTADRTSRGAQEPALALRYYLRDGNVDWHTFARVADRTGSSAGAAVAWVASDSIELHASARFMERADSMAQAQTASPLQTANPWQASTVSRATQAVVGGTWTHQSQLSVLMEAWWDGTALSAQQWSEWRQRNRQLQSLVARGLPGAAVAGNLAWQADAFSVSNSLQQSNLFVRVSWEYENWQPSLDMLLHPEDGGHMVTATLVWRGDRVKVQGGVRVNGGPSDAVLAQLPAQRQTYVVASWAF